MLAHFYAIASYGLQHPDSMNYTAETLAGLRKALDDALEGRAKIHDLRQRARRASKSTGRITRRAGDTEVLWRRGHWPMTVADVLSVEKNAGAYADRVLLWARSVREALDENQK